MKRALAFCMILAPLWASAAPQTFDGWIVGRPCALALQVADCPLRHTDQPVLLLEDGGVLELIHGERGLDWDQVDRAYGKKVRINGQILNGILRVARLDIQESTGERKFFKGCL